MPDEIERDVEQVEVLANALMATPIPDGKGDGHWLNAEILLETLYEGGWELRLRADMGGVRDA
jgi:hypothetical protein